VTRSLVAALGLGIVLGLPAEAACQAQRAGPDDRAAAQSRLRERFARLLRERVGLSDDQLRQLAPISQSFEARRQAVFGEERAARQALRRELSVATPNQEGVARAIDQLLSLQRRRLDLAVEEQRELATFMTPVQRARYLALQDLLRRRAEEMRRRRGNGPPRGGRRGLPRGAPSF
jgi:hypothetical protein